MRIDFDNGLIFDRHYRQLLGISATANSSHVIATTANYLVPYSIATTANYSVLYYIATAANYLVTQL